MPEEYVKQSLSNGVLTLTLDHPENKNALSPALVNQLVEGLREGRDNDRVRVLLLTNVGNTFCAGADLKAAPGDKPMMSLNELLRFMTDHPKPIVGEIAGHCMGGGVGLAAACDISVIDADAKLGFTEVRLGVAPAVISLVCLSKLRRADALDLFLTGRRITGAEASDYGLINYALPAAEVAGKAKQLCEVLLRGGPNAIAAAKQLVMQVPQMEVSAAGEWASELSMQLFKSEEAAEGIAAFREKRDAAWIPNESDA